MLGTLRGMTTTTPLLVSIDQAGDLLGVRRSTVNRLVYSGILPSLVIGRRRLITIDDLTRFVAARKTAPGALGRECPEDATAAASVTATAAGQGRGSTSAPSTTA
jgi:excisionase family DNA binding protein